MVAFQQETCNFNPLNHSMNLNYVQTSSPYRAVNTYLSVTKTSQLILYREMIAVYFEIHTEHENILCG